MVVFGVILVLRLVLVLVIWLAIHRGSLAAPKDAIAFVQVLLRVALGVLADDDFGAGAEFGLLVD